MELDSEQRTESIEANGEAIYIVLRDGEWLDQKEEQRIRRFITRASEQHNRNRNRNRTRRYR